MTVSLLFLFLFVCDINPDLPSVWAAPQEPVSGRRWLSSHSVTLINHLVRCPHSTDAVRQQASGDLAQRPTGRSSRASSSQTLPARSRSGSPVFISTPPPYSPSPVSLSSSSRPSPLLATPPLPVVALPLSGNAEVNRATSASYVDLTPGPSFSNAKLRHAASSLPVWTNESQRRLETSVARMIASTNTPLSWVDDPEVHAFFARFIPGAQPISRRVLTSRLIPTELEARRAARLPDIRNADATLQCDGWAGGNFRHYTGFTMTIRGDVCDIIQLFHISI